jgi:hypothetical protein
LDRRTIYILTGISPNNWWARSENHHEKAIRTTKPRVFYPVTQEQNRLHLQEFTLKQKVDKLSLPYKNFVERLVCTSKKPQLEAKQNPARDSAQGHKQLIKQTRERNRGRQRPKQIGGSTYTHGPGNQHQAQWEPVTESTPSWCALGATASGTSRKSEFGLGNTAGGSGHKKTLSGRENLDTQIKDQP